VYEIDLERLWRSGKRILLTDLDNTLVPWQDPHAPPRLVEWLSRARQRGFEVCIISNNRGERVRSFAERVGVAAIGDAGKPRPRAFCEALRMFGRTPAEAVMIGDQLFTDVRGGKRCGLYTILVAPISPLEWWGTKLVRRVERWVWRRVQKEMGWKR
ncbi:MAG: YqeG family HAD IIIA-type phosphatase, partial [Alicyclobacillaceae bacterium]|nr:YqeG family HAD IIIA-type phosphatase [Alicyclobacillaceae bacterium]